MLVAKSNRGSEKINRPKIINNIANIIEENKIIFLIFFATFLVFALANHESKTNNVIKIIIPKKTKFI